MHQNVQVVSVLYQSKSWLPSRYVSDETNSYIRGKVNKQNTRYWSCSSNKEINDWWYGAVFWILMSLNAFFNGIVTGENYLNVLPNCLIVAFDKLGACLKWCMQYGAPRHYALSITGQMDILHIDNQSKRNVRMGTKITRLKSNIF
jgi:hypothetical protein